MSYLSLLTLKPIMNISASAINIVYGTLVGVNWAMESPPIIYTYGESMPDFYLQHQQWLNYEKKWKTYRLSSLPCNVFFSLPPLLLSTTYISFPNLNCQPCQESGLITARRSENAQKTVWQSGLPGCQTVLLHLS